MTGDERQRIRQAQQARRRIGGSDAEVVVGAAASERLPTTPQIFSRLSAAMKNPDISVEEIVSVVQLDASLSARVLRLSNSAQFGRGDPITSLDGAINRIGFQEVYRLVGAAMSFCAAKQPHKVFVRLSLDSTDQLQTDQSSSMAGVVGPGPLPLEQPRAQRAKKSDGKL